MKEFSVWDAIGIVFILCFCTWCITYRSNYADEATHTTFTTPRRSMERTLVAWAQSSTSRYANATCVKVGAYHDYEWLWPRGVSWDNGRWYRRVFGRDIDDRFSVLGWTIAGVMPSWTYDGIKDQPSGPSCGENCTVVLGGPGTTWHLCRN